MDQQIFETLHKKADEFGSIAKKVNESSELRKTYSEKAIKIIDQSLNIGDVLQKDLEYVAKANIKMRNQDNIVLNTCLILRSNVEEQKELIDELKKDNPIDPEVLELCSSMINNLSESIKDTLSYIQQIIEMDNNIILMDKKIIMRKQFQQDSLKKLKEITKKALQDSKEAIKGSSSNLDRGLKMVKRFKNVKKFFTDNNLSELKSLVAEANKGWDIAVNVNKSSTAQFEYAERVNNSTKQLHDDSITIKDMVIGKHKLFERNLQIITVLTVILSLKFQKYLQIEEIIHKFDYNENISELLKNFIVNARIACKDVRDLGALNYDMADSSHINNEIENKAVRSTEEEIEYFNSLKLDVEAMTEATRYPVEGSSQNITNGKILEKNLQEIIHEIKN